MKLSTKNHKETLALGEEIAKHLKPGDIILLFGDLGAGKTTLTQGLCIGLGLNKKAYVSSPTFTLMNQYKGIHTINHIDLYRLDTISQIEALGLEENLFPSQLSLNSRSDLEEERRLFYVAVTRGETKVTLSYATSRYKWGNLTYCEPSRFIEEIDSQFLELPVIDQDIAMGRSTTQKTFNRESRKSVPQQTQKINQSPTKPITAPSPRQKLVKMNSVSGSSSSNYVAPKLTEGMKVEHERFGTGTVKVLEGPYPNQKATVSFTSHGEKKYDTEIYIFFCSHFFHTY